MAWDPFDEVEEANDKRVTPEQMRWLNNQVTKIQTGKFTATTATLRDLQHSTDQWTRYMWEKSKDRTPGMNDAIVVGVQHVASYEGFGREVFGRLHNSEQLKPIEKPDLAEM